MAMNDKLTRSNLDETRALADRVTFVLSPEQQLAWEQLNQRPARDLPSLRALVERPSPFVED